MLYKGEDYFCVLLKCLVKRTIPSPTPLGLPYFDLFLSKVSLDGIISKTLLTIPVITYSFQFIIQWKDTYAMNTWCENVRTRDKKKLWRRKDRKSTDAFQYPWKEITQEKRWTIVINSPAQCPKLSSILLVTIQSTLALRTPAITDKIQPSPRRKPLEVWLKMTPSITNSKLRPEGVRYNKSDCTRKGGAVKTFRTKSSLEANSYVIILSSNYSLFWRCILLTVLFCHNNENKNKLSQYHKSASLSLLGLVKSHTIGDFVISRPS